jgi:thiamine-phosphate pyrophosphorylase
MKLAIMTKPTFFVEEDKILATLFECGLDNLHLYKPNSSPIYSERLLSLLPEQHYNKITVHDHFYLKEEYRLAGIHIDNDSVAIPNGYKGHVSGTCHTIADLKMMKKKYSYVFLGNIFDAISLPTATSCFTMNDLEAAAKEGLIDRKVYAIGGISIDRIQTLRDLGFGGVVVCGDLWNKFNIHNQIDYKELINHFERIKKIVD